MIGRIRVATSHGFSAIIAPAAMEIDQTLIAYALAGGAVGGLVRGYSGFGFAMAAVPIMAIGISPAIAVPSVLVHELAIGLFSLKSERKRADLSLLRWMCLGSLVGTPLGLFALSQIPDQVMRIAIGLVLLLSVLALWVFRSRSVALRPPLLSGAGFASGLLNGSTAMSGPPVVLTLLGSALLPAHVRGLSIYFIAFSAAIGVGISMLSGMQTQAGLVLVLLMIPGVIAGVLTGNFAFRSMPHKHYRTIALSGLLLLAIASLSAAFLKS